MIGSTELLRSLIQHDLVDELRLINDPIVVGGGKRIFPDGGELRSMTLEDIEVTTTGATIAKLTVTDASP